MAISNIITCTYDKIRKHEETQARFSEQFDIWKTTIVNKYFYVKLEQSNGVTVRLVDYYIRNNVNGVRLANEFIYLIDDVIYMEKLDNYVMMIPIQLFVSFDNFYDFDRKIKDLITEISKYISIDDPSPILMCNIIDLNCTLDLKYPKISSDCYFDSIVEPILCHVSDTNIHICVNERENWNSNLSECQAKEIYAEKIHYHDYAECGLQTITVDAVSYCSVALDSLIMIGDGLTISVDNNVISLNI